jgi:hypothetical protein
MVLLETLLQPPMYPFGVSAVMISLTSEAYLHYIRRQNPVTEANAETVRATITNAYEYALRECGTDRESGEIWQEYIAFVSEPTVSEPEGH